MIPENSAPCPRPMTDRVRAEQANAWIAKWQARAPNIVLAALSGKSLTVYAVPSGGRMFTVDWSDNVTVNEAVSLEDDYRFLDVQNALIFLDALLMNYVARLGDALAAMIVEAPRKLSPVSSLDPAAGIASKAAARATP